MEVSDWLLPLCMEARDERCLRALQKHLYTVKLLIGDVTFPGYVETGSSSFALCLFGADIAEGGMGPALCLCTPSPRIGSQIQIPKQ
ncbi:MAG: hypothetical protein M3Z54_12390 [Gemmatimonadota bacterium]|nr:hypothetical protein [Gemmatimonadota bacterium]